MYQYHHDTHHPPKRTWNISHGPNSFQRHSYINPLPTDRKFRMNSPVASVDGRRTSTTRLVSQTSTGSDLSLWGGRGFVGEKLGTQILVGARGLGFVEMWSKGGEWKWTSLVMWLEMHLQVCFACFRGSCSVIAGSCSNGICGSQISFGNDMIDPPWVFWVIGFGWLASYGLMLQLAKGGAISSTLLVLQSWTSLAWKKHRPTWWFFVFFHPSDFRKSMSTNSSEFQVFSFVFLVPLISWTFGWKLATEIRTTLNTAMVEIGYPSSHNHGSVENNLTEMHPETTNYLLLEENNPFSNKKTPWFLLRKGEP